MILAFVLTMPGKASWNGKWTGDGQLWAIVKNMGTTKKAEAHARKILAGAPYGYHWSDGWAASVEVKHVTAREARTIRKKSKGFWGYNWMVKSILECGEINTKSGVNS